MSQVTLQNLSPKHKEALSLMAQGVERHLIATITGFDEDYLPFIARQEVAQAWLREVRQFSEAQFQALYATSVSVVADVLTNGTEDGRLKAAKLQLEYGAPREAAASSNDRLERLGNRLLKLLETQQGRTRDGQAQLVAEE
jgi:hypothetical protein